VDLAIDWLPVELDPFVNRKLFDDRLTLIARGDHPFVSARITIDDLRKAKFVTPHLRHVPMRQREGSGDHQGSRSDDRGQGLPRLPARLLAPALDLSIEPCPFGLPALFVGW
jgi:DNA-binding transcriptional LysR family regulator